LDQLLYGARLMQCCESCGAHGLPLS
jgi:hypothetical protein